MGYLPPEEESLRLAGALLDAEVKIGELLQNRPEVVRRSRGGTSNPLPAGMTHKQSHAGYQSYPAGTMVLLVELYQLCQSS